MVPDVIIAANGAISRVQKFYGKCRIIGVVSHSILIGESEVILSTLNVLKLCKVNDLIIVNYQNKFKDCIDRLKMEITNPQINYLTRGEKSKLILSEVKFKILIKYIFSTRTFPQILKVLLQLIVRNHCEPLRLSTGAICILLALAECLPEELFVIGIGLDAYSSHHYDKNNIYGFGHLESDSFYFSHLKKKATKIHFTDSGLR